MTPYTPMTKHGCALGQTSLDASGVTVSDASSDNCWKGVWGTFRPSQLVQSLGESVAALGRVTASS